MIRRELALVLRARVTWVQAAIAALLTGHGFILAVDLYTSGSRSVEAGTLMAREFDPLLGIVRPTLGGLFLSLGIFGPLTGARALALETERRTMQTLLLQRGSTVRVVMQKWGAACIGALLSWLPAVALLLLWSALGGHLDALETAIALLGYALYASFTCAIGVAAGAFARSLAQASTLALVAIAGTIAIDASEGFSALAWLGSLSAWSPTTHLRPFERGTFAVDATSWFVVMTILLLALASVGLRPDRYGARRLGALTKVLAIGALPIVLARHAPGAWDGSETARHSLPPAAARALAELPGKLHITARLDREDSRRSQLESDTLAKLRLARPDLTLRWPMDEAYAASSFEQDASYGHIRIQLGDRSAETTSTSRREIVTLIFSLADQPLPDWSRTEYPGYPLMIGEARRPIMLALVYGAFPLFILLLGLALTTYRRRTP